MDIVPKASPTGCFAETAPLRHSLIAGDADSLVECEESSSERFRQVGLRATHQRVKLGKLLFAKGDRHTTAELLFSEARKAGIRVSLATVYNTLNHFTKAGLLRRVGPDASRAFFDTNTSVHPHFYLADENRLVDVPEPGIALESLPQVPPGHELSRVDVIIHLRRKPNSNADT